MKNTFRLKVVQNLAQKASDDAALLLAAPGREHGGLDESPAVPRQARRSDRAAARRVRDGEARCRPRPERLAVEASARESVRQARAAARRRAARAREKTGAARDR